MSFSPLFPHSSHCSRICPYACLSRLSFSAPRIIPSFLSHFMACLTSPMTSQSRSLQQLSHSRPDLYVRLDPGLRWLSWGDTRTNVLELIPAKGSKLAGAGIEKMLRRVWGMESFRYCRDTLLKPLCYAVGKILPNLISGSSGGWINCEIQKSWWDFN